MRRGDDGTALMEFSWLAVLLMVPLVYVLLTVFEVQRASFGVIEAARQAGRAYVTADDTTTARSRAAAAARLAMRDQGLPCSDCLTSLAGGLEPDARVTVSVGHVVQLPLLGAFFDTDRGGIRVDATHIEHVDRFRESR